VLPMLSLAAAIVVPSPTTPEAEQFTIREVAETDMSVMVEIGTDRKKERITGHRDCTFTASVERGPSNRASIAVGHCSNAMTTAVNGNTLDTGIPATSIMNQHYLVTWQAGAAPAFQRADGNRVSDAELANLQRLWGVHHRWFDGEAAHESMRFQTRDPRVLPAFLYVPWAAFTLPPLHGQVTLQRVMKQEGTKVGVFDVDLQTEGETGYGPAIWKVRGTANFDPNTSLPTELHLEGKWRVPDDRGDSMSVTGGIKQDIWVTRPSAG